MFKKRDQQLLAEVYNVVHLREQINDALLNYLEQHSGEVKHYKKFAKVKAYQSKGNEQIQTKIDGRDETDVRTTNPGDWVVSNIESQGEQQIVDDKTFQKRYDVANPKGDIYSPKGANFFGVVYDGSLGDSITFAPPNWGGSTMNITKGYMIGGPDPKNFGADFYGIDPDAFKKTYKPAEMVTENRVYRQDGAYTPDELRANEAERNYRSGYSRDYTHYASGLGSRLDDEDGPFHAEHKYQTKVAMSTDSNIKKLCGYMGYKDESKQIRFKNPENIVYIGIKNIDYTYSTDWYDAGALNRKKEFGLFRPGNKPSTEEGAQLLQIGRVGDDRYKVTVSLLPYSKWNIYSDLPKKEILNTVVNFVDLESVLTKLNEEIESGKYDDVIGSIRGSHEYPINKGEKFHSGWPLKKRST